MRNSILEHYESTSKTLNEDIKNITYSSKSPFDDKKKKYKRKPKKLTQQQIEVFKQAFEIFDSNKSGTIDEEELQSLLSALGYNCTPAMIHQIMEELDSDGSGVIELDQFIHFMSKHMLDTQNLKKQMTKVFDFYDDDRSGFLDEKKIKKMIGQCFFNIEDEAVEKMVLAADTDGDHKISKYEFLRLMKKIKLL